MDFWNSKREMKKLFLVFLIWPFICSAQTKPREPRVPSGNWAINLIRAYAFSRLDSVRVDSVKDFSSNNVWGIILNSNSAHWQADGSESPRYTGSTQASAIAGELEWIVSNPSPSLTNQFTIVQRLNIGCSGICGGSFGITNRTLTPINTLKIVNMNLDASAQHWCLDETSCVSWDLGGPVAFKTTIIFTYAGDSLRTYQDGNFKGATVKTGNIATTSYTTALGLFAEDASTYRSWNGSFYMTCIWSRVLTSAERTQIWNDPYVMFKIAKNKGFRNQGYKNQGYRNL